MSFRQRLELLEAEFLTGRTRSFRDPVAGYEENITRILLDALAAIRRACEQPQLQLLVSQAADRPIPGDQ
jgi:hypothetical protein